MDPRAPYLSPKYFKQYKKFMETSLNILFSYLRIWNYEICGRYVYLFSFFTCWKIMNIWNLENITFADMNFEMLNFWIFGLWNFELVDVPVLRLRKVDTSKRLNSENSYRAMMTIPVNKIFKILDMNFISIKKMKSTFGHFCIFK